MMSSSHHGLHSAHNLKSPWALAMDCIAHSSNGRSHSGSVAHAAVAASKDVAAEAAEEEAEAAEEEAEAAPEVFAAEACEKWKATAAPNSAG